MSINNNEDMPKKLITIDKVQIGMVLAENIQSATGLLLIPEGTLISEMYLYRLEIYKVRSLYVYDIPKFENKRTIDAVDSKFADDNEHFGAFVEEYQKTNDLAKQYLSTISEGNFVAVDDLFNLSNSLLSNLNSVGDVFNYLYHLKVYDDYTFTHCINVSMLCNIFGRWLNMGEKELKDLTIAGLLHDIGKISIDNEILNKPGKLSPSEFEEIKQHPLKGFELIKDLDFPYEVKMAVLHHHEKFDGTGYPFGLKNHHTCKYGKIVAIADIYDAMTSDRVYHKRKSPFDVIRMFENGVYHELDTKFLFVFLENVAQNYVGATVKLTNDEIGKIVFVNTKAPSRPYVENQNKKIYDLSAEKTIDIKEIL